MATSEANGLVRQLRRVVAAQDASGETDGKLLGLFVDRRDCAAFEALVRRHGPMVLGTEIHRQGKLVSNCSYYPRPRSASIMAIIDFATARRSVVEQWLPGCEEDLETSAILFDERTEEHEWGWLFHWGPKDPSAVPHDIARWGYRPILVDRMTGKIYGAGTGGLRLAVARLLWERERS